MPRPMTYIDIVDDIASRIASGEYQPGAKLPSYRELAALYGVGISTAQRVYFVTNTRGLTYGMAGRGVFVTEAE